MQDEQMKADARSVSPLFRSNPLFTFYLATRFTFQLPITSCMQHASDSLFIERTVACKHASGKEFRISTFLYIFNKKLQVEHFTGSNELSVAQLIKDHYNETYVYLLGLLALYFS
jgi:hypothetical protein